MRTLSRLFFLLACLCFVPLVTVPQDYPRAKPRARDLGVPFDGTPGGGAVLLTRVVGSEDKLRAK